jgi:hypothetical protein
MPDSKLNRLMARLKDLERKREHAELYGIRCPTCHRWPWQIQVVKSFDELCDECHRIRQQYPNPFGDERTITFVLDADGILQ